MSFFSPKTPAAAPMPQTPTQDPALLQQQAAAANSAMKSAPQTQTNIAGMADAYATQQKATKGRKSSADLLG